MILYNVWLMVGTAPEHPPFWDNRRASLLIWVFGRDGDHALDRALRILACLPYELRSNEACVTESEELRFDDDAEFECKTRDNEEIARSVGLSVAVGVLRETPENDSFPGAKIIQLPTRNSAGDRHGIRPREGPLYGEESSLTQGSNFRHDSDKS